MDPYECLANAIILSAVEDYRLTDNKKAMEEIERFFLSDWFMVLTPIDPEMLLAKLREEKKRDER